MDSTAIGKALIVAGALVVVFGVIVYFGGGRFFSVLGKLPGDIRIEGENSRIYIPIGTSIVISIVFTLVLWMLSRFR